MPASKDTITRLCALAVGVGRYLAEVDAGYSPDDTPLRLLNRAAQTVSFEDLSEYAKDAIIMADRARDIKDVDQWAILSGRD